MSFQPFFSRNRVVYVSIDFGAFEWCSLSSKWVMTAHRLRLRKGASYGETTIWTPRKSSNPCCPITWCFRIWQVAHRILSLAAEYMELVGRFPTQMVSIKGVSWPNSRLKAIRQSASVLSPLTRYCAFLAECTSGSELPARIMNLDAPCLQPQKEWSFVPTRVFLLYSCSASMLPRAALVQNIVPTAGLPPRLARSPGVLRDGRR